MVKSLVASPQSATRKSLVELTRDFIPVLQKKFAPQDYRMNLGLLFGEQAKYVSVQFSDGQVKKWGRLEISHLTDIQYGHVLCNTRRVGEYLDWILEKPYRYIVLGGDLVDAWAMWSPGSPHENLFNPQSQVYRFCMTWARVQHRILGYVGGNHERRAIPAFGDLGVFISTLLQLPYSAGKQWIDIHFGQHRPFTIDMYHGRGAARTKGAKLNMLHDQMKKSDAQLVLVGHVHDPMTTFDWRPVRDSNNLSVKFQKQGGAISSSFLDYLGGYAEVGGFSPSDVMMARAVLDPDGKWELTLR